MHQTYTEKKLLKPVPEKSLLFFAAIFIVVNTGGDIYEYKYIEISKRSGRERLISFEIF